MKTRIEKLKFLEQVAAGEINPATLTGQFWLFRDGGFSLIKPSGDIQTVDNESFRKQNGPEDTIFYAMDENEEPSCKGLGISAYSSEGLLQTAEVAMRLKHKNFKLKK